MSVLFFDGFDFYTVTNVNSFSGGLKWDQGSFVANFTAGRWGGQAITTNDIFAFSQNTWNGLTKTLATTHNTFIIGCAMRIDATNNTQYHPLMIFTDTTTEVDGSGGTTQFSLRINPAS